MGGERTFFEDHALQSPLVVFEQFCGPEIARDQDGITAQALRRRRAKLARNDPQQPVRQIFKIVHPVCQQRIVDLAHAHPGVLLDAFDRRLGGQSGIDCGGDPAAPAFIVSEHLIGFEHFVMLTADAKFGLRCHPLDLFAHLAKGQKNALVFGICVFGDGMFDGDARLVEHRGARCEPFDQR